MATKVGICNKAIDLAGGTRILSLDDEILEAQICSDNFDIVRDMVLEASDWTFATKRYVWTPEAGSPAWGYQYQFTILPEVIRIINVSDNIDDLNGESDLDWRREENLILTDASKLYVKAIKRITDTSRFSAGFVDSMSLRLGAELAIPIAGSRSLRGDLLNQYAASLGESIPNENSQGKPNVIQSKRYTRVR